MRYHDWADPILPRRVDDEQLPLVPRAATSRECGLNEWHAESAYEAKAVRLSAACRANRSSRSVLLHSQKLGHDLRRPLPRLGHFGTISYSARGEMRSSTSLTAAHRS